MKNEKFITPYGINKPPIKKVFKWKIGNLFKAKRAKCADDDFRLKVHHLHKKDLTRDEDFIVWLGHASFYIQLDGIKILTDPVFGNVLFIHRLVSLPIDVVDLNPDIILISHGHYDHFDLKSLNALDIYAKTTKIIMPLKLSAYLKQGANVKELNWYEKYKERNITIQALPASHWHRRKIFDFNEALWCSFFIKSKNKTIFFAGDTAFGKHFQDIKKHINNIDLALLPIGAYLPREVMKASHLNPKEALEAAKILDAKMMIPYHYGTFKLSDEPIGEPHTWISKLAKNSAITINIAEVGKIINLNFLSSI